MDLYYTCRSIPLLVGLHQRPGLLAVNKLDVPGSKELYNELKHDLRGLVNDAGLNIQTVRFTAVQFSHTCVCVGKRLILSSLLFFFLFIFYILIFNF